MSDYIERYWRDAKPADAIKEPPMVARFRYEGDKNWKYDLLVGWDRTEDCRWRSKLNTFEQCQVYDAPDPGEGWRLVDVDSETPQHGDEFFAQSSKVWCFCNDVTRIATYSKGSIIRRRITPTVTYVPFTWEDRDQLRGRIITFVGESRTVEFRCEHFAVDDDGLLVHDYYASWLCKNAVFVDTDKPVGKEVTQ